MELHARGSWAHRYAHDPTRAEAIRRNASKAARSKPSRELVELKVQLGGLADAVLTGELDKGAAAVVNQLLNTKVRVIALERDVRAQEDFEARIAEARHEPPPPFGAVPPLPPVLEERFIEALIPQVERRRQVFAKARPQREAKRRMAEEWDDSHGDRYGKGREWLRKWDRERAELRERYEGWEKKWQCDYAEWRCARGAGKPEAMRSG